MQPPGKIITEPLPTIAPGVPLVSFDNMLTFVIRLFFIVAGLAAILYLLLGAFAWITSGGAKEQVEKAQQKIQAAIIGLIVIFVVLSIVILLESVLNIGLGISKPILIPKLTN